MVEQAVAWHQEVWYQVELDLVVSDLGVLALEDLEVGRQKLVYYHKMVRLTFPIARVCTSFSVSSLFLIIFSHLVFLGIFFRPLVFSHICCPTGFTVMYALVTCMC